MEALLILLAFPLIWPFIAKRIWHTSINWTEMTIQIVGVTILTTGVWYAGIYGQMSDTEVWNGYVTEKKIEDGYYQTSYCCGYDKDGNCTTTCYTDHYTRHWNAYTTVGKVTFDYIDTTSRSRRNGTPPPHRYNICKVGEPAAIEHRYTNYVQATPESLFHDDSAINTYADQIPAYPRVYDFYRINRVINNGTSVSGQLQKTINDELNNGLKMLGAQKQVNIVVILTDIDDPNYRYAVERAWLGGEKNDVVIFLGGFKHDEDGPNFYEWVDVMTWALNSGNELFHVKMRDRLKELGTVNSPDFVPTIIMTITELYDRPQMKDFEYLEEAIDPPTWVIILAIVLAIGGSIALTIVFHYKEVDDVIGEFFGARKHNRYRRY